MNMAVTSIATSTHAENALIQLVSFSLSHEEYGVEVLNVREIIVVPTPVSRNRSPLIS